MITAQRATFMKHFNLIAMAPVCVTKWRRWKPSQLQNLEPLTQRQIENHVRTKWQERTLAHFITFAALIPFMFKVMSLPDPDQECKDLFGKTRFGTYRGHCLNLQKIAQITGFVIPWAENEIRLVLNHHRAKQRTPARVQTSWNTFKFFSKKLGLVPPDALSSLKEKKDAVSVFLTPLVRNPQHESIVPPVQVLILLEHGCMALLPSQVSTT